MINVINAKTISDAWFQLLSIILERGYRQEIQQGSFAGSYRYQLTSASIFIEYPHIDMVPEFPPHLNIPAPSTMQYIEEYLTNYLMSDELRINETYTYGSRIHTKLTGNKTQYQKVVDLLKYSPFTNHAVIEIASPFDFDLCHSSTGDYDPPCLRLIDFKVLPNNILTMSVYFRSWDLWGGFPVNLGGLELFKQIISHECNLSNGPIYAYSSGLHIYSHHIDLVKKRLNKL